MEFSQRMQFLPSDNTSYLQTIQMEYLLSANHPDNRLTIVRQLTICLPEYYSGKPDNLTVFQKSSLLLRFSDMGNSYS